MKREVAIQVNAPINDLHERDIRRWVDVAAENAVGDVCIRVVTPDEIRELNLRFREIDEPTNVLAFPADPQLMLGDLAICSERVASEAEEQMKSFSDHFAHLVVHGVLHLRGFDHELPADAETMELKEVCILQKLGISNPYELAS